MKTNFIKNKNKIKIKHEDKQNTKIKPVKSRRQKSQNTKKRVKALKNLKTLKNEFIPLKNLKT